MEPSIQSNFPALAQTVHDYPLRYLDTAASALKPRCVVDAVHAYYDLCGANVHRGIHALSEDATERVEHARDIVAAFIGAPRETVIFTSGTTESINGAARMMAHDLRPNDEILITELEHHSNIVPWFMVAASTGARVVYVPLRSDGTITADDIISHVNDRTRVIAFTMTSNALGTHIAVAPVCAYARRRGIRTVLDAAQSIAHAPLAMSALGCDFLAFSGHKLYGPTGVGVLAIHPSLIADLVPWKGGGGMIDQVTTAGFTAAAAPARFEAGTPPIAEILGLAAAVQFIQSITFARIATIEHGVAEYAHAALSRFPLVTVYGTASEHQSIISFNVIGIHAHDIAAIANSYGIALRAGHHCAQPAMRALNVPGTVRASIGMYTTREDIDALLESLQAAIKTFS